MSEKEDARDSPSEKKQVHIKIALIGDSGVGKTSLLKQYTSSQYIGEYKATIGADFYSKDITVHDTAITLNIVDTAGQERFRALGSAFWRDANACILIFDVTSALSFTNLIKWKKDFFEMAGVPNERIAEFPFFLVGNKLDLSDHRVISRERALEWCQENRINPLHDIPYTETSAKENYNVEKVFQDLAECAYKNMAPHNEIPPNHGSFKVYPPNSKIKQNQPEQKKGCCY